MRTAQEQARCTFGGARRKGVRKNEYKHTEFWTCQTRTKRNV